MAALPVGASYEALTIPEGFTPEPEYRLARCRAFASRLAGRSVAIYGSGINACRVIEGGFMGEIVAVVDDNAIGMEVAGFRAMGIEDVPVLGVKAIIVCARASAAFSVFRRIGGFCREHGIAVYSMYGFDLSAAFAELCAAESAPLVARLQAIARCDVLAVDAGVMPLKSPVHSIGSCLAQDGQLASCLGDALRYAVQRGCRIVVVSEDPEMTPERVAALVERSGLPAPLRFFLSSDTGLACDSGMLRALCEMYPGQRVGVLCSNAVLDRFDAAAYGVEPIGVEDVWHPQWKTLESAAVAGEANLAGRCDDAALSAWARNDADRMLARCAEETHLRLSAHPGEHVAHAVRIIGPLVVGFVLWLAHRLRECPCDAVLFSARDGWIIKDVYDRVRATHAGSDLPPSVYLYASRLAGERALGSSEQRDCAYAYFASCGLKLGGSYAFVDFVGAGTCQRQLGDFAPFSLHGYYVGSRVGDGLESELDCTCLLHEADGDLTSCYLAFEPYLSSEEPSVTGFSADGRPMFAHELRSQAELETLRCVHAGIRQYARMVLDAGAWENELPTRAFLAHLIQALPALPDSPMSFYDDLRDGSVFEGVGFPDKSASTELPASDEPADIAGGRTVHDVLLGLLTAFDTVCAEFGLTYIASHGTLLGAVRHGGFVPWDDDLDVAMPRADYDKLLALAEQGVFPEPFFLQTPENEPAAFFGGYAKLRDSSTSAIEADYQGFSYNQGIWIDILPLDACSLDNGAVERQQRIVRQWQWVLYAQSYGSRVRGLWNVEMTRLSAYFILARRLKRPFLCKGLRQACMACADTGMLTVFTGNYQWARNNVRYAAADVAQAVRVPFEDTTIPIPVHAHHWLDVHYGRGWQEEPVERVRASRHEVEYDPDMPYWLKLEQRGEDIR